MELDQLKFLCQKHGLMKDAYDSPVWSQMRKKEAMVSRLQDLFGLNPNELSDTDNEDENGEKYLLCIYLL